MAQSTLSLAQNKIVVHEANTEINFAVNHFGVLKVNGSFENFTGEIDFHAEVLQQLKCTISVNSIKTDDPKRDEILKNENYLNSLKFPKIDFVSSAISENVIIGTLKIKAVSKKIKLKYAMPSNDLLVLSTVISRSFFQLNFGAMDAMIGDEITIEIQISL